MNYNELKKTATEIVERRTMNSATFEREPGKYTIVSKRTPIHYKDSKGTLQQINLNIEGNKVTKTFYDAELLSDVIGYSIISKEDGSIKDVSLSNFSVLSLL